MAESLGLAVLGSCRAVPAKAPLAVPERCAKISERMCPAVLDSPQDSQGLGSRGQRAVELPLGAASPPPTEREVPVCVGEVGAGSTALQLPWNTICLFKP